MAGRRCARPTGSHSTSVAHPAMVAAPARLRGVLTRPSIVRRAAWRIRGGITMAAIRFPMCDCRSFHPFQTTTSSKATTPRHPGFTRGTSASKGKSRRAFSYPQAIWETRHSTRGWEDTSIGLSTSPGPLLTESARPRAMSCEPPERAPRPETRTSAAGRSWRIQWRDNTTETCSREKIRARRIIMACCFRFNAALRVERTSPRTTPGPTASASIPTQTTLGEVIRGISIPATGISIAATAILRTGGRSST